MGPMRWQAQLLVGLHPPDQSAQASQQDSFGLVVQIEPLLKQFWNRANPKGVHSTQHVPSGVQ
jgi:hypothetical protein